MMTFIRFTLILCLSLHINNCKAQHILEMETGKITFVSDAPLELIKAENKSFQFLIDTVTNEFAISIPIKDFYGFNSALQREHFFENFMETAVFPKATFTGKIIDDIGYRTSPFDVIVRGQLTIHGVKKERIIEVRCVYSSRDKLLINSQFTIPLDEHEIEIPRIVFQKIAEFVTVNINAELIPKD